MQPCRGAVAADELTACPRMSGAEWAGLQGQLDAALREVEVEAAPSRVAGGGQEAGEGGRPPQQAARRVRCVWVLLDNGARLEAGEAG